MNEMMAPKNNESFMPPEKVASWTKSGRWKSQSDFEQTIHSINVLDKES